MLSNEAEAGVNREDRQRDVRHGDLERKEKKAKQAQQAKQAMGSFSRNE